MRIPRPKNTTLNSINYNKTNDNQFYQKLIELIVTEYINQDFRVNGKPISLNQLSDHYNIPLDLVNKCFIQRSKDISGFLSQGDLIATHERLLGMAFSGIAKDRSLVAQQLTLLLDSQGDTYKPFISGTVNEALKMMMGSTKNMIDFIDKVMPKNSEMVGLILNGNKPDSLTAKEAISLIRQEALGSNSNKALPPKSETQMISNLSEIYQEHNLAEMPSVSANSSDEAANINVTAKKLIEDPTSQIPKSKPLSDNEYGLSDYEEV